MKKKKKRKKKPQKKSVIDNKKATNVSIFLVALKKTDEEIKNAIYMLNKELLNPENLNKLMDNLPDEEDIKLIKRYLEESKESIDKLERPEQYLYTLHEIPHLKDRLDSFLYVTNFDQKMLEMDDNLTLLKNATLDLKEKSTNFNKLLQTVWGFGNYVNSGTLKGNAPGFQLRSLLRLKDTKSTNNEQKYTLLNLIVKNIESKQKEILEWVNDFESIKYASKVSFQTIKDDFAELEKGIDDFEKKIPLIGHSNYKYDVFESRMPDQIKLCRRVFEEFRDKMGRLESEFAEILVRYGLSPQTKPEELFSLIESFMNDFNLAKKDNAKKGNKKKLEKEKENKLNEIRERKVKKPIVSEEGEEEGDQNPKGEQNPKGRRKPGQRPRPKTKPVPPPEPKDETVFDKFMDDLQGGEILGRRTLERLDTLTKRKRDKELLDKLEKKN